MKTELLIGGAWIEGSERERITVLDPATGEAKRELTQKMTGPMSHDRCYRNRITHDYYINSKSGGTDLIAHVIVCLIPQIVH